MNEWMNEWMDEWMNINKWMKKFPFPEKAPIPLFFYTFIATFLELASPLIPNWLS